MLFSTSKEKNLGEKNANQTGTGKGLSQAAPGIRAGPPGRQPEEVGLWEEMGKGKQEGLAWNPGGQLEVVNGS